MKTDWKKVGTVLGALAALVVIAGAFYTLDCFLTRAEGDDYFVEIPTFLAMQKQVEGKFIAWDIKDKQKQISEYDAAYGQGCQRCDSKLKTYYDWLILERDRLIDFVKAKAKPPG